MESSCDRLVPSRTENGGRQAVHAGNVCVYLGLCAEDRKIEDVGDIDQCVV